MSFSALRNRVVGAMANYLHREYDAAALLNFAGETPIIRRHLLQFYSALFFVSMSSALGSCLCFTGIFGCLFAAFQAYAMFRAFRRAAPSQQDIRVHLLVYCAFFVWACATPWFTWFLGVNKGFVVSKMLSACVVFGCFWLASKQQHYPLALVYLRAVQFCSPLLGMSIGINIGFALGDDLALWRNQPMQFWIVQLYWCLVCYVVVMYVVLYSQEVVLRARGGDGDHVEHALHLYTDFPAFVIHLIRRRS